MRKVLLIGHVWPYHTMAGNCIYAIAKYLPEFGWEPIILTTPLDVNIDFSYQVVEVPYLDVVKTLIGWLGFDTRTSVKKQISERLSITARKSFLDYAFSLFNEVLSYPDSRQGWRRPALKKGAELIEQENIKAIITDNPPVLAQLIAKELRQKYQIPWVVYFSHLWSQNNGYSFGPVRRMLDRRLELKTLKHTDLMVTHSDHQAAKQRALFGEKPVISVFEGFSPEDVNDPPSELTKKFTITYTGTFAPGLREPDMLFTALENLITAGSVDPSIIEVRFYGTSEIWVESEIEKHGLSRVVRQFGKVSMEDSHARQRESHLLFNPKWDDPDDPGIYAGKFFEYLAARRPILATGKYPDVVDDMLTKTGAGIASSSVRQTEQILESMYSEYLVTGVVKFRGETTMLEKSTHRDLARIFAIELDRLVL